MTDQQKHILIIEDEKPLSNALKLKLESKGFYVAQSFNGKDGLARLSSEPFDIVLLDVMMPIMDGFQVLRQLQSQQGVKPVIFVLSNLSQTDDESLAYKLGAKKFFIKSNIPLNQIADEVAKTLNEPNA